LLKESKEQDWFDFKSNLKWYQSDGKLVERHRDELIKDILGMANGNSQITRKTKYLIIGADDKKFDENGFRVLYDVDYKVPSQSDLAKWLYSACSPAIVGLECELVGFQKVNLFIISIPPTFELHETTRELNAAGHYQKHVVFMRQDEHTVPASVRDGVTIQNLKHVYRQEISNPSSVWIGVLTGGIAGFILGAAKIRSPQIEPPLSDSLAQFIFTCLGVFLGGWIGWSSRQLNEIRYDWRYLTWRQRITLVVVILMLFILYLFLSRDQ
jgi:hypothetical protein